MNRDQVRIFISHSSHDRSTADSLKDLICIALPGLSPNQVLCTSLDGYGVQPEGHFSDHLREMIVSADVALAIISPESMVAPYVLFELGARWGSKKKLISLLAPGVGNEQLRGPLMSERALKCLSEGDADLHLLLEELESSLSLKLCSAQAYVGHFAHVKKSREHGRSTTSIFRGFLHLESTLFHEVEADVRKLMGQGDESIIPTKYLFAHADSHRYYKELIKDRGYNIAAQGNELFADQGQKLAEYLLTVVAPNRALTIVSLGTGFGIKEGRLLRELLKSRVQVSLLAIDQNPAFIQSAIAQIKEDCKARAVDASLICEFMIGDFDHIEELSAFLSIDRPTIFLALGGTFGNQDEISFLRRLRRACKGEAYLLMDFDTIRTTDRRVAKSGYDTQINREFISSMFKIFCEEKPRRVVARSAIEVLDRTISSVGSAKAADVIVMEGEFHDGRKRYFGYSTRYNKLALEEFLGRQSWPKVKEFDDPGRPSVSLILCKLESSAK